MKIKVVIPLMAILTIIFISSLISCNIFTSVETTSKLTTVSNNESKDTTSKGQESKETDAITTIEVESTAEDSTLDQIKVTKPTPNQLIESPLTIEGEARGTWFFEATFPVKLLDTNGDVIATYFAQAQGEWMTEDFVPFKTQLIFEKPSTDTGILILEKDNPSGLPKNDARIEIPVRFSSQSEKIVEDTNPQKGEYFVNAILKSIDIKNNTITVEQLINEPNEKEIPPEVNLSDGCKIVKVILERPNEKETVTEITLDSIKLGSEIGIIFKSDNTARAIIYQEIIEK
ncbi:Gmad2 immunoglobulin-like domain-containing protein [bacterium]|nr:Gmad2 immunoglobulin-like domain-containing protein [bacterium]